jgi:hypothetical protein
VVLVPVAEQHRQQQQGSLQSGTGLDGRLYRCPVCWHASQDTILKSTAARHYAQPNNSIWGTTLTFASGAADGLPMLLWVLLLLLSADICSCGVKGDSTRHSRR